MRIVIAADTYYPNIDGASMFTQRLAEALKDQGHRVLVIAPSTEPHTLWTKHNDIPILGIRSLPTMFHKDYRFTPPFFIKALIRRALTDFKPDVVHVQGHFSIEQATAAVAKQIGIPVIGTNHFMPENLIHYVHAPIWIENILKKMAWWQFRRVFNTIPVVTTPTKTAAAVLQHIGLNKVAIPQSCGINLETFKPTNTSDHLRERFHLPSVPIVLSVSRLAPEKNIDAILRAAAEAFKQTPLHVVVAGNGMDRERLEKLTEELGFSDHVTFTGFVSGDDLPHLYRLASVFVMAGNVELQSLVTMEAMASGLPVVAVNALALPELVHDGVNGFLFEPGRIDHLTNSLVKLLSSPELRESMAKKSLEIIQTHDITKTIKRFEELYQSIQK